MHRELSVADSLSRRRLLQLLALGGGGAMGASLLGACTPATPTATAPTAASKPTDPPKPAAAPTTVPAAPKPTSAPAAAPTAAPVVKPIQPAAAAAGTPKRGGTLVVGVQQPIRVFNPVDRAAGGPLAFNMIQVFEGPLRLKAGGAELEPAFAEKVDISADGKEFTIRLRPNLTFHDGTPLDASAYKFSLEMLLRKDHAQHLDTYVPWEDRFGGTITIQDVDPRTVKLTLSQLAVNFDYELSNINFVAVSPTAVKKDPQNWGKKPMGAGSGPFLFEEEVPDQHSSYTRFPNYWESGKPYLDRVIIQTIPNFGSRLLALTSGRLHVMPVSGSEIAEAERDANVQIITGPGSQVQFLLFDHADPVVGKKEVRQAISHALDRESLVKQLVPGGSVAQSLGSLPGEPGRREDIKWYGHDPARARQLLAEAGYPNGIDVTLTYNGAFPFPDTTFFAQAMQAELARSGIRVKLQEVDRGTLFQAAYPDIVHRDFAYQMLLAAIGSRGDAQRSVFNWTYLSNYAGHRQPYVDLVDQASREPNREKRMEIWGRAQGMLYEDAAAVPISHTPTVLAARREVQGLVAPFAVSNIYFKDVWLS